MIASIFDPAVSLTLATVTLFVFFGLTLLSGGGSLEHFSSVFRGYNKGWNRVVDVIIALFLAFLSIGCGVLTWYWGWCIYLTFINAM
jgi:hypothetical protein